MNYGDKHTEDGLNSRLGRLYGIERGLDCGPNIIMDRYWKIWDGGERQDLYAGYYEADFLYITKGNYLYEVEIKISITDFRADQKRINTMTIQTLGVFIISFRKSFTANIKTKLKLCVRQRVRA